MREKSGRRWCNFIETPGARGVGEGGGAHGADDIINLDSEEIIRLRVEETRQSRNIAKQMDRSRDPHTHCSFLYTYIRCFFLSFSSYSLPKKRKSAVLCIPFYSSRSLIFLETRRQHVNP